MNIVEDLASADVIIVAEDALNTLKEGANWKNDSRIVVLLDSDCPTQRSKYAEQGFQILSKPVGPYKLAKALIESLSLPREIQVRQEYQTGRLVYVQNELQNKLPERPIEPVSLSGESVSDTSINESTKLESTGSINSTYTSATSTGSSTSSFTPSLAETLSPGPPATSDIAIIPASPPILTASPTPQTPLLHAPLRNPTFIPGLLSKLSIIKELKILCVDDNVINLRLVQTYLKKLGYQNVSSALDGKEAFDIFVENATNMDGNRKGGFDLVFMGRYSFTPSWKYVKQGIRTDKDMQISPCQFVTDTKALALSDSLKNPSIQLSVFRNRLLRIAKHLPFHQDHLKWTHS